MRILHVIDSLGRGGAERVVVTLAKGQAHSHHVSVVCLYDELALAHELREAGIAVQSLHATSRRALPAAVWNFSRLLRRFRADVIHAHLLDATLVSALVPATKAKRVATFHNLGLAGGSSGGARTHATRLLLRALSRRFDLLTAVSEAAAAAYESELVLPQRPLVVNNPIDVHGLRSATPSRSIARASLGLQHDELVLVCVAKLTWEKNHTTLLDSLAAWRGAPVRVVMLGDGPLAATLHRQSGGLPPEVKVVWSGVAGAASVALWLRAADASVLPSVSEGQPISLLESMVLETPVVATTVGGVPDLLAEGRGWLVPPADSRALGDALMHALSDPVERQLRARAAAEHVAKEFALESVLPQWERLLR